MVFNKTEILINKNCSLNEILINENKYILHDKIKKKNKKVQLIRKHILQKTAISFITENLFLNHLIILTYHVNG